MSIPSYIWWNCIPNFISFSFSGNQFGLPSFCFSSFYAWVLIYSLVILTCWPKFNLMHVSTLLGKKLTTLFIQRERNWFENITSLLKSKIITKITNQGNKYWCMYLKTFYKRLNIRVQNWKHRINRSWEEKSRNKSQNLGWVVERTFSILIFNN